MTDTPRPDRAEDDMLAAEYALGLLDGAERDAFEARLRAERALEALVADWQERLAPMTDAVAPVPPRAAVKVGVMDVVRGTAPHRGLWSALWLWRGLAAASLAAAVALGWLLYSAPPREPGALFVVDIRPTEGNSLELIAAAAEDGRLRVERQAGGPAEGRVLQLWALVGDSPPVSLGVLPAEGRVALALPETVRGALPGVLLAVSDEPPGGSPTGQPTGEVLAVGQVSAPD